MRLRVSVDTKRVLLEGIIAINRAMVRTFSH